MESRTGTRLARLHELELLIGWTSTCRGFTAGQGSEGRAKTDPEIHNSPTKFDVVLNMASVLIQCMNN